MSFDQYLISAILTAALLLFVSGKWRHDVVSVVILLAAVLTGLVDPAESFSGFGHPAVVTVAAVLIVSRGLFNSGLIDFLARKMTAFGDSAMVQLSVLMITVTALSGFMNNIGALALLMPVAIRMARKSGHSVSLFLMPLAFGSLLGGLLTQVGTPANIIVSSFRTQTELATPFRMFDFAPVGGAVAIAGVFFVLAGGWRLIPLRKGQTSREERFDIGAYITELQVSEGSSAIDMTIREIEEAAKGDIPVVSHTRSGQTFAAPSPRRKLRQGDTIIVQAGADDLQSLLDATGLTLTDSDKIQAEDLGSEEIGVIEATIRGDSYVIGKDASRLQLRSRYGMNLLGVSRGGGRLKSSPSRIRLKGGDVLLLQGGMESMQEMLPTLGFLPLAERGLRLVKGTRIITAVAIFACAIILAATGLLQIQVALMAAATIMVLTGFVPLRELYDSIDWPVIVLLGAMIPVSSALETTGAAGLIASLVLKLAIRVAPWVTLTLVLFTTQLLSDVINNAAAALLMAPIAVSVATGLGASLDPFLMCIAVGASCSFLTPIGHQSNTLVMGPGGYRFGDYWRLGLPLTLFVVAVAVPMIMLIWPLGL